MVLKWLYVISNEMLKLKSIYVRFFGVQISSSLTFFYPILNRKKLSTYCPDAGKTDKEAMFNLVNFLTLVG